MRQLEKTLEVGPPSRRPLGQRRFQPSPPPPQEYDNLGLDDLTGFCDYVAPPNALRHHRRLRASVADRHLEMFFDTIHIFLPIFDREAFRTRYSALRPLFGDNRLFLPSPEYPKSQQFLCLLYAVLALGALYEDEQEDSSSWASWYFAEAQDSLGHLLDAANLELVQAAMLMGAYAQHAIKPNLAYILNGIAARLAFSIGLNTASIYSSGRFHAEEVRRTWWLIYIQEVELSLDSGRPMSIRTSDMDMDYPVPQRNRNGDIVEESQIVFIRYLGEVAKIMRSILNLVNHTEALEESSIAPETEALRTDLQTWYASLPQHLRFHEPPADDASTYASPCSWQARQQSSLRIHYNLAIIILLRGSLSKQKLDHGCQSRVYQDSCLSAARDMVKHIHHIFRLAPSLRRWSYYCFYCLQAILVLLTKIIADDNAPCARPPSHERASSEANRLAEAATDMSCCEIGIRIFEQIELKASQRCAEVVRRFLDKCKLRMRQKGFNTSNRDSQGTGFAEQGAHQKREVSLRRTQRGQRTTGQKHGPALALPEAQLTPTTSQLEPLSAPTVDYCFPSISWSEAADHSTAASKSKDARASGFACMPLDGDARTIDSPVSGPDSLCVMTTPISLGGLETELYGALHGHDYSNYDLGSERQNFFLGSGGLAQESSFMTENAESRSSARGFAEGYDEIGPSAGPYTQWALE
ncbi:uncharacterized protein A1O5_06182 [Cladophialophora psammophila CBS 110553]|uniref:Xylanolytic transcriptional activator regulatory domain-containing protein n=1 Tax=Cladophialophora psammophila CBS 110553 TaxID=1182543 RepID=W9WTB2_9EURO|nr:uncharacterized protein A1O5_06182 [Cladophialophora psammophila CBS 110553]EXJ71188.1 hypothetical protein A1O5_06182 [Cladophialophora psammophila CBS 110553]